MGGGGREVRAAEPEHQPGGIADINTHFQGMMYLYDCICFVSLAGKMSCA